MGAKERQKFDNKVIDWVDERLPIFSLLNKEYGQFPVPKNFNYFWNFGAIAMFMLVTMILTGIFLTMHYTPHADLAFSSVERIMRDVNQGWLIRYLHMNGASFFFIAVYIHVFRGMYYGSYKKPRELLWILGVTILFLMMATAFMGYTLPWSQMSGWGAKVITGFVTAIPFVGDTLQTWLLGGFTVDNATLKRFFALHYLMPFVIFAVVFLHVWALHISGSNNPSGIEPKTDKDVIPFHPYYTLKDVFGLTVFVLLFVIVSFFYPKMLTHPDHFIEFQPLVTPAHIVPEWYFLPFYAILRAWTIDIPIPFTDATLITAKLGGVLLLFGAVAILFFMPWLDSHPVKSARYRPIYRVALLFLVASVVALGYVGAKPVEQPWVTVGQFATLYYFAFFLIILPLLSRYEVARPMPNSIHDAVLKKNHKFEKKTASKGKKLSLVLLIGLVCAIISVPQGAKAAGDALHPEKQSWSFQGITGQYDKASLQRGFQVYQQVCASCHSLKYLYYRDLAGLGYSEAEIKAIAAQAEITDGPDDTGEYFERPGKPFDRFQSPFANDEQAKAVNGGKLPPDLSLINTARHGGADYIHALLVGFEDPPTEDGLPDGVYLNPYFPGGQIGMAPPLVADGQVDYADGTEPTVVQMSKDVTHFLQWASDPHMETRKRTGLAICLFLIAFSGIMYAVKKKIWADLH